MMYLATNPTLAEILTSWTEVSGSNLVTVTIDEESRPTPQ